MNKAELITEIANNANLTEGEARRVLDSMITTIELAVMRGDDVRLPPFGTFERRRRLERQARSLETGKAMTIPATNVPAFNPGQGFKEVVASNRAAPVAEKPTAPGRSRSLVARAPRVTQGVIEGDLELELDRLEQELLARRETDQSKLTLTKIRKDRTLVKKLKASRNYSCQFPGCQTSILKADGTKYVEVAHIESVANGGKSTLSNLLVLCPNHHKEFDLGNRNIDSHTSTRLAGTLNGKRFVFSLK